MAIHELRENFIMINLIEPACGGTIEGKQHSEKAACGACVEIAGRFSGSIIIASEKGDRFDIAYLVWRDLTRYMLATQWDFLSLLDSFREDAKETCAEWVETFEAASHDPVYQRMGFVDPRLVKTFELVQESL